jgi:phenylacetate-coenzyme A ligase PaaK-like adenylate-forming protein
MKHNSNSSWRDDYSAFYELSSTLLHRPESFEYWAVQVFKYQAQHNPIYRQYIELLGVNVETIERVETIPFLPIELFKSHSIQTGSWQPETIFTSSGTTGQISSRHRVRSLQHYLQNARQGFQEYFLPIEEYCVLALLPAYLERQGSSLVAMADDFIRRSKYPQSGFFLYNYEDLATVLQECQAKQTPTLLLGVTFALLDLAEQYPMNLSTISIMETGGMKGRRKELTRQELHEQLMSAFQVEVIHSEYGMTELLSQAYTKGGQRFYPTATMRVLVREVNDPFYMLTNGRNGALNIIDLANVNSCSFIATQDLGKRYEDGSFEVLGRMDNSDLRGCNLMLYDG